MELNAYQAQAKLSDQRPGTEDDALVFPLLGLASEVGSLVNQYKKRVRDREAHELFSDRVAEELGDVLWYVANLAGKLGLDLEGVAQLNLRRIAERWPGEGEESPSRLLDDAFPPNEQLPRQATVTFVQEEASGRRRVRVLYEGRLLGDPLYDMAWIDDDYRFHDAFHLTYAAMLGWSPVARAMFERQRNSDERYREVEDSGRAKVTEEAIAVHAFEYARMARFLEDVKQLDFALLQTVSALCSRLEVRVRTVREWEQAILRSFEIWRALRHHGGGMLHLDLLRRTVAFEPPTE